MEQASEQQRQFGMVEIDGRVVDTLASRPSPNPTDQFLAAGKPRTAVIGLGDKVSVTIWQAASAAQAGSEGARGGVGEPATIPEQVVGPDGAITVPFAGRIAVSGRTPMQVQTIIEQRLTQEIAQPQVVVAVTKSAANSVTISGEQVSGARVPLSVNGDRLLDVIAAAGGSKAPIHETSIRVSRNGQSAVLPMAALVSNPAENIYVWPGDVITLLHTPNQFVVFGATANNVEMPFGSERLSLAQAIAKAGGLSDSRADPEGVFLFRFEDPAIVDGLRIPRPANYLATHSAKTPVVYHLDLRRVDGYFLAKRFAVQNDDLIYVANARLTELQKFFTLIGTITGPVIGGVVVTRGISN